MVGVGASVQLSADGTTFESARIALAAVAPRPLFVPEAGESLAGKPVNEESMAQAAELAQLAAAPITDMRGTAEFRKHIVGVLTRRTLAKAVERARGA